MHISPHIHKSAHKQTYGPTFRNLHINWDNKDMHSNETRVCGDTCTLILVFQYIHRRSTGIHQQRLYI